MKESYTMPSQELLQTLFSMYGMGAPSQGGTTTTSQTNPGLLDFATLAASVAGIASMFCWVAREVYGIDNPKWMLFREWMTTEANPMFVKLYFKYGQRFAKFIRNKPRIKNIIRTWMDRKIDGRLYAASI